MSTLLLLVLVAEILIASLLAILITVIVLRLPLGDILTRRISNRRAEQTEQVRVQVHLRNSDVYTGVLLGGTANGFFTDHEIILLPPLELPGSLPSGFWQQVAVPVSEIRAIWVEARPLIADNQQPVFDGSQEEWDGRTTIVAPSATAPKPTPTPPDRAPAYHANALSHPLVVPAKAIEADVILPPADILTEKTKFAMDNRHRDETARQFDAVIADAGIRGEVIEYRKENNSWHFIVEAAQEINPTIASALAGMVESRLHVAGATVRPATGARGNVVDIEVRPPTKVRLASVLSRGPDNKPLAVALGEDKSGNPVIPNLTKLPHLFMAGSSRSALDEVLDLLIADLLLANPPYQLRLMLFSPSAARLRRLERLPHLLSAACGTDDVADSLKWLADELDSRQKLLNDLNCRTIADYNLGSKQTHVRSPLPIIVVLIEEIDHIMKQPKVAAAAEQILNQLGATGRPFGIHLIIATGEPPPGLAALILANIPARLALAVPSAAYSEWIIGTEDARELEGTDDMILARPASASMSRLSRAYVTAAELQGIVAHWTRHAEARDRVVVDDNSELLVQAAELIVMTQFGSASMIQRKLRIGFAKAGRLMDLLESGGIVGHSKGPRPRDVLVRPDELPEVLASLRIRKALASDSGTSVNPIRDEGGTAL